MHVLRCRVTSLFGQVRWITCASRACDQSSLPLTSPLALLLALVSPSLSACGTSELAPDAPIAVAASTTPKGRSALPPIAPSVVDAPISYAIGPALKALEQSVPAKLGNIDQRITIPNNKRQSVAFAATRTPFTIRFDGHELTLATIVSYQGRGWYQPPIGPTVSASCGTSGPQPRIRVVITSAIDVQADWKLHTRTRVRSVAPYSPAIRDQCRVTMFNVDVTDRVVGAIRPLLAKELPQVDRKVAAFDVRTRVEGFYNLLNKSIRVQDSLWLLLAPSDVRLGGIRLSDTALVADVRLVARPVLVTGPQPAFVPRVLPPLGPIQTQVGDSAHLLLEGLLGYDVASVALSKQLVGRHFSRLGRRIGVTSTRLYALNDGRVALELGVDGALTGKAYFVGTPLLDTTSRMLTVPDLDFDVATANALVAGLAWVKKGDLVAELRRRAQVPLEPILEETRARVEQALNRQLTEGVILSGTVQTGRLIDVAAEPRFLVVRAEATGSLGLGIDKEISVRRATSARPKPLNP